MLLPVIADISRERKRIRSISPILYAFFFVSLSQNLSVGKPGGSARIYDIFRGELKKIIKPSFSAVQLICNVILTMAPERFFIRCRGSQGSGRMRNFCGPKELMAGRKGSRWEYIGIYVGKVERAPERGEIYYSCRWQFSNTPSARAGVGGPASGRCVPGRGGVGAVLTNGGIPDRSSSRPQQSSERYLRERNGAIIRCRQSVLDWLLSDVSLRPVRSSR